MKNKGFTLVEVLAVIVILGIITAIASISVTRYRKQADDNDLLNLHSSIETSYSNYRTVLAESGEVIIDNPLNIGSSENNSFDKYFEDLSYNGERLNKTILQGSTITLYKKDSVFSNPSYTESIKNKIEGFNALSEDEKNRAIEKQYIIDATCVVVSTVCRPGDENKNAKKDICKWNPDKTKSNIVKTCKLKEIMGQRVYSNMVPSNEELVCLDILYNGTHIIDDVSEKDGAKSFNTLCKYVNKKS